MNIVPFLLKTENCAFQLNVLTVTIMKESWNVIKAYFKGEIYDRLLKKNAEDTKNAAGQYFRPRALIQAMVEKKL